MKKKKSKMQGEPDKRLILKVFLGSPGDLARERQAVKSTIDRLNVSYGRTHNVFIELLRWEDITSGKGRPQARINEELLKEADLFIGLLWKKWGSPTGEYTSGFEEEFVLAQKLKNISDIQLFFKTIPKIDLEVRSDDVIKVIEFRGRVEGDRNILFKEFRNITEWSALINDHLLAFCGKRLKIQESVKAPKSLIDASTPKIPKSGIERKSTTASPILSLLDSIKGKKENLLDRKERARLFVLSSALLYSRELPTELLPTHEINLLFRDYKKHKLVPAEEFLVLRTLIEDKLSLKPGWYWLRNVPIVKDKTLLLLLVKWQPDSVKINALSMLKEIGKKVSFKELLPHLSDENEKIVVAAIDFLGATGTESSIPLLDNAIPERVGDVAKASLKAKIEILTRLNKLKAAALIVETPTENRPNIQNALDVLLAAEDIEINRHLIKMLADSNQQVRRKIIKKFVTDLPDADVEKAVLDEYGPVKEIAFKELVRRGKDIQFKDVEKAFEKGHGNTLLTGWLGSEGLQLEECKNSVLKLLISKKNLPEIVDSVQWGSKYSELSYEVLAQYYFEESSQMLIEDVRSNFERLKRRENLGPISKILLDENNAETRKINLYTHSSYLNHISKGILHRCGGDTIPLARLISRQTLGILKHDTVACLVAIFSKFGDSEDLNFLWDVRESLYGEDKKAAVASIIKYSDNRKKVIDQLLKSDDEMSVRAAIESCKKTKDINLIETTKALLNNPNEKIRNMALAFLLDKCTARDLENLLDEKLAGETYYYNVVCYLDRILFAPTVLSKFYRNQLTSILHHK